MIVQEKAVGEIQPFFLGADRKWECLPMVGSEGRKVHFAEEASKMNVTMRKSAKNLIGALYADKLWLLRDIGYNKCSSSKSVIDYNRKTVRTNCKTASFVYRGNGK